MSNLSVPGDIKPSGKFFWLQHIDATSGAP
jgi:hypothetical protein